MPLSAADDALLLLLVMLVMLVMLLTMRLCVRYGSFGWPFTHSRIVLMSWIQTLLHK